MNKKISITLSLMLGLLLMTGIFVTAESSETTISEITEGDATTQETETESGIGGNATIRESYIYLSLNPVKNLAGEGQWASYSLKIHDDHPIVRCLGSEKCADGLSYTYTLDFNGDGKLSGDLSPESITLKAGESKEIKLAVKGYEQGAYSFIITAKGKDSETRVKGALIVGEETHPGTPSTPQPNAAYFIGDGFALNSDETSGELVSLVILEKDSSLSGKISFGSSGYKIEGTLTKELSMGTTTQGLKFDLVEIDSGAKVGSFSGTLIKFEAFSLLKGTIDDGKEPYTLTATSKDRGNVIEVEIGKVKEGKTLTSTSEVISINSEDEDEDKELYIRPIKIRREKIFGFIPNPWGKKVLDVEVIEGEKVTKAKIRAREEKQFGEYTVTVGDLEDEENIELDVEETKEEA